MATELPGFKHTGYRASTDLSGSQYLAVKISGVRTVTVCTAITDKVFGILQNTPAANQTAEIMASGRTKMVANAAIAAGDTVGIHTNGRAKTIAPGTDTTQYIVGIAEDAATAAGDIISVWLPGTHCRAT